MYSGNPIVSSSEDINFNNIAIPKNENRKIKVGILDNYLKYSVIKDNLSTDQSLSHIAVSVGVGSEMDPEDSEGLAHFLEHMLFLGSKNYPGEKQFEEKVKINGGMTNAYTSNNTTVYYLSILHSGLEEILDMFSQFFISPLFNIDAVDREVRAVDSEHKKNIQNDMWRIFRFKSVISNRDHPSHKFSTGSLETLSDENIREKMIAFYNEYYCSNNISISISTSLDIDDTIDLIKKYFSAILPKNEIKAKEAYLKKLQDNPVFRENTLGNWYQLIPVKDIKLINYIWTIPSEIVNYESKIWSIVSYVFRNTDKGSLYSFLIDKGYIETLYTNIDNSATYSLYTLTIVCSKLGMENLEEINSLVSFYINKIKEIENWNIYATDYINILQSHYDYGSISESSELIMEFVEAMSNYNLEEIYTAPILIYENRASYIPKILEEYLDFDKSIKVIISQDINLSKVKFKKEQHYKLKYRKIDPYIVRKKYSFDSQLLGNNTFIPKKIVHLDIDHTIPIKIDKKYELWVGQESRFDEPIISGIIQLHSNNLVNTPENFILSTIIITLIEKKLIQKLYMSSISGYGFNISLSPVNGNISLSISGFNSNYFIFLNKVLMLFFQKIELSKILIKTELDELMIHYKNRYKYTPIQYGQLLLLQQSFENIYETKVLIQKLKKITVHDILNHYKVFLIKYQPIVFFYGNLNRGSLKEFNFFNKSDYGPYQVMGKATLPKKDIKSTHPNKNEKNNLIKLIFPIGEFNPKRNVIFTLFIMIFEIEFYDYCRTKKQLGYIVNMNTSKVGKIYSLEQTIQSTFEIDKVLKIIDTFNYDIDKKLNNLTHEKFSKWKNSLKKNYLEPDTNTAIAKSKYVSEFLNRTFMFDRYEILENEVDAIKILDLISFNKEYMINNERKFKLTIEKSN